MNINHIQILTFLYSLGGTIGFIGFIPTIIDLIKGKPSANIRTYLIWSSITTFSLLYGLFVLRDLLFNLVMGSQLAGYVITLFLSVRLKYFKKQKITVTE